MNKINEMLCLSKIEDQFDFKSFEFRLKASITYLPDNFSIDSL